jgi:hypothetical protein
MMTAQAITSVSWSIQRVFNGKCVYQLKLTGRTVPSIMSVKTISFVPRTRLQNQTNANKDGRDRRDLRLKTKGFAEVVSLQMETPAQILQNPTNQLTKSKK